MGLSSAIRDKAETFAIGYFIHSIENGRYGKVPQETWLALKGKKTIVGFTIMAIGGALMQFPDPSLAGFGSGLALVGTYLGRLGLIAKGADKNPPAAFPEEYRAASVAALSGATYFVEILTALAGLFLTFGSDGLQNVSMTIILACQAVSTATGYFSTLIGPTPVQAAKAAIAVDVKAVEAAEVVVEEKKADVVVSEKISTKAKKKEDAK